MPANFAVLEDRVNRAIFRHLANAMAQVGASEFAVIFDMDPVEALDGMADVVGPQASALDADVYALTYDSAISIDGAEYTVTAKRPDGSGVTVLQLRKV